MPVPERALVALHAGAGDGVLSGGEFEAPCPYAAHHAPGRISLVPGGLYRLPLHAFPPPTPATASDAHPHVLCGPCLVFLIPHVREII